MKINRNDFITDEYEILIQDIIKFSIYKAKLLKFNYSNKLQNFFENNNEYFLAANGFEVDKDEAKLILEKNNIIGLFDKNLLVAIMEFNYIQYNNEAIIEKYIVDRNYRGNGIAVKFLNLIEEFFKKIKIGIIYSRTTARNSCVANFFQRMNYTEVSRNKTNSNIELIYRKII